MRDFDRRRGDRRVVFGAIEIDDEHLAFDDADELVLLRRGDDARRGGRGAGGGRRGVVVTLVGGSCGGNEQADSSGTSNGGGAHAVREQTANMSSHGKNLPFKPRRGARGPGDQAGTEVLGGRSRPLATALSSETSGCIGGAASRR